METQTIVAYHIVTYTWMLAYIGIIRRGFKDQSYGMPIVALALNLGWEVVFAFFIPPYGSADAQLIPYGGLKAQVIFALWATLNSLILYTYFKNGYKYFEIKYAISRLQWTAFSLVLIGFSFLVMYTGGQFFRQFTHFFDNDHIKGATFIAFIQNAIMSMSFVAMFYMRGSTEGQSFYIALFKWIGTSMTGGVIFVLTHPDNWQFVGVFLGMIFLCDVYYMAIIYRALQRKGINPWKHF